MSTRTGSTKKANGFNEAAESQYDPYPDYPVSESFTVVPWPEWNDADLNCEVWEEARGKPSSTGSRMSMVAVAPVYEDPNPPKLPLGVREYVGSWKRPREVFPGSNLTVYGSLDEPFGLSVASPVAECDFFKSLCEIVDVLCRYASTEGFQVEMESGTFVPTTLAEPWRPWHHVYALTKAGKGQIHRPLYSSYGKYVVRLFHFGSWRRLTIDDRIPCDKYGLCMLPVTQCSGELWPLLLAKGLLKIMSLTGSTLDFSIVSCLTGWISGHLTTGNKTPDQVWRRFQVLIPRFELTCEEAEMKNSSAKGSAGGRVESNGSGFGKLCVLVASLGGFAPDVGLNGVNVIVTMNRDLPLVKANRREGTKSWKRFRWVYWASEKGIWTDELLLPPYRRLQYISFAKELDRVLSPDPLQEATLYDVPVEGSISRSRPDSEDEEPFEPSRWSDFYRFYEYLVNLNVFLKPSSFSSNLKITCVRNDWVKKDSATPATAKTVTKTEPQNEYFYSPDLTPTQNQPILLYCESSSAISICFSLSVCPSQKKSLAAYLDSQQPEILKVGHGTLIIERHDWRTLQQGELIGFTKTVGNSSVLVNLKPGRHVLRLWLNCDSPYVVHAFSNVELTLHKGPKIRYQMVNESDRILDYISNVSNAFIGLCLKFGKPDLPPALRDFYRIIKPGNDTSPLYHQRLDKFIQTFLNSIMSALKSLVPNIDDLKIMLGALRSLFVNPDIDCDLPPGQPASLYGGPGKKPPKKVLVLVAEERTLSQILAYPWTPDEINRVITIQRIFRGYRIRLLFKYQTPARKESKPYADRLKKICDTLFVPARRDVEVGKILRMIVVAQPDLLTTFKFHLDFPNVLDVEEFAGRVAGVEPFAWTPLARFIVSHHSPGPVPCAFYVSCNLQQFVVQVVDNDTNDPVFSLANTVSPCYYPANVKGYTVFVFGWNESSPKTVNWRLEMVKMKHFDSMHLCNTMVMNPTGCHPYAMPNIEVNEIKNFYVPNRRSRMCRCTIKVRKRSLLTLRLSASYPEVRFALTITLDERHWNPGPEEDFDPVVLKRFSTNGAALLSSIVLENVQRNAWGDDTDDDDDDLTLYLLEAHVLDDSWPLTKQEWGIIEPMRVIPDTWKDSSTSMVLKKGPSESRRKLTRMSKRSLQERAVDNPCWILQVLTDSSEGDEGMTVEEDRSCQESVRAMKVLWEERSPGRRKKARDVRVKFLQEMYLEKRLRQVEEGKERDVMEGEVEGIDKGEDFSELLHKMTSFSYLTDDRSRERFARSPRVLPWMPTQELLNKYRREWTKGTKESASSESCSTRGESRSVADEEEEDRREFLTTCNHYRAIVANYLAEEQKQSNELMEQAYKQRLKAVQRMMG